MSYYPKIQFTSNYYHKCTKETIHDIHWNIDMVLCVYDGNKRFVHRKPLTELDTLDSGKSSYHTYMYICKPFIPIVITNNNDTVT